MLKVVEGGLSKGTANTSALDTKNINLQYISGTITDTRLMGVIVISLCYALVDDSSSEPRIFRQYFYIGIDEGLFDTYRSCFDEEAAKKERIENSLIAGLGGRKVPITEKEARILIATYAQLNLIHELALPQGLEEYSFLLEHPPEYTSYDLLVLMDKMCTPLNSKNELINYFIMRYFAKDVPACLHLCGYKDEVISPYPESDGIVLYNKITQTSPYIFMCDTLVETEEGHFLSKIELSVGTTFVNSMNVLALNPISEEEASLIIGRTEYISHFKLRTYSLPFSMNHTELGKKSAITDYDMGTLYMIYKDNNNHVDTDVYYLNDDVLGMYFASKGGDLLLVSSSKDGLSTLKEDFLTSGFSKNVVKGEDYIFRKPLLLDYMLGMEMDFLTFLSHKINRC